MVEKQSKKLKAKGKGGTAPSEAKSIQSAKHLGAQLVKSVKRFAVRSSANVAKPTAVPSRPTTPWTAVAMTAMVSPSR